MRANNVRKQEVIVATLTDEATCFCDGGNSSLLETLPVSVA